MVLKKQVILGCLATVLAVAQEKTTDPRVQRSSELISAAPQLRSGELPVSYVTSDVKVLGALDYGQTSKSVTYSATPRYRAFVFSGYGGEKVEATVRGMNRKAFVAIADSSLNQIASGTTHLSARLPYRGPDIEVWYIVFRDVANKPTRFAVHVTKTENTSPSIESQASPED